MKVRENLAISDTGFVFDPTSGDSFSLNPIATDLMNLLKNSTSMEDIKFYFVNKYEVSESTVEKDVIDFISVLKQHGLTESEDEN
ncbi:MAG: HPr-rel-A system PqqD family protein [Marinilabiliales bacterium]|nr:MAG: HPr-rel-A system PqqD family protein [Marinilabiliales bacterium]